MILITGGAFQGKLEFAKTLKEQAVVVEGEMLNMENAKQADIVSHFHLYIRKLLEEGKEPKESVIELLKENPHLIVEVTEMGCGIVPVEAFDRNFREMTGRICCEIGKQADAVYRVTCGIGTRIK